MYIYIYIYIYIGTDRILLYFYLSSFFRGYFYFYLSSFLGGYFYFYLVTFLEYLLQHCSQVSVHWWVFAGECSQVSVHRWVFTGECSRVNFHQWIFTYGHQVSVHDWLFTGGQRPNSTPTLDVFVTLVANTYSKRPCCIKSLNKTVESEQLIIVLMVRCGHRCLSHVVNRLEVQLHWCPHVKWLYVSCCTVVAGQGRGSLCR